MSLPLIRSINDIIKFIVKAFGIGIFLYILWNMDYKKIAGVISDGNIHKIGLAIAIIALGFFLSAFRYCIILKGQDISLSIMQALQIYFLSSFWGLISPARIGTLTRIAYLEKHKIPLSKSVSNVVWDRLIDMGCVLIYFLISLVTVSTLIPDGVNKLLLSAGGISIATVGFSFLKRRWLQKKLSVIQIRGVSVSDSIRLIFSLKHGLPIWLMSMGLWGIYFFSMYLVSSALLLNLSFMVVVFCVTSSNLISIIPVSIGGIGTRDAWLIFVFNWAGYEAEKAVLFSGFFLLIYLEFLVLSAVWMLLPDGAANQRIQIKHGS